LSNYINYSLKMDEKEILCSDQLLENIDDLVTEFINKIHKEREYLKSALDYSLSKLR
jgi:hypothetical protein